MNFIFSHLNAIALLFQVLFLVVVTLRFFRPRSVKNISFQKLIWGTIITILLYGAFVTWGQHHVWARESEVTKLLLSLPLSERVPFPAYLEWLRPLFAHPGGYFLYYVLGRVWLHIFIGVVCSGILYLIFKMWAFYRAGFSAEGPQLLLVLFLLSGWPGVLVTLFLGLCIAVILSCLSSIQGNKIFKIEPAFISAAFLALLFTRTILGFL